MRDWSKGSYKNRHNSDEYDEDDIYQLEEDELEDDEDEVEEDDWDDNVEKSIELSFACEDCDYRWDDIIEAVEGEIDEDNIACPMCGSVNITQI